MHEPGITGHVGGHYRRQPASDPVWLLLRHARNPRLPQVYAKLGCAANLLRVGTKQAVLQRRSTPLVAQNGYAAMVAYCPRLKAERRICLHKRTNSIRACFPRLKKFLDRLTGFCHESALRASLAASWAKGDGQTRRASSVTHRAPGRFVGRVLRLNQFVSSS
jgi:hypothetical protein